MKECTCIIIDDNKGFSSSSLIKNFLKRASLNNRLNINLIQLNPKDEKFVDENGAIQVHKVMNELSTPHYLKQLVHLIACDYNLGDDNINGFDMISLLRNELNCKKKILLYSSNIDDVVDRIIQGKKEEIVRKVIELVNSNIAAFCKRDEHLEEAMIKYLQEEIQFSTDKYFETELYKYGDYEFKPVYDRFQNKTLREVAEIIATHVHEGERLKKELIEQVIAYMIKMNHD